MRRPLRLAALLLLVPAALRAGNVERLGDFGTARASFPADEVGSLLGAIHGAQPGGGRALACITAADRPGLWAFGATPESAEPLGGSCPNQDYPQERPVTIAAGTAAETLLWATYEGEIWRTDGTRAGTSVLVPLSTDEWRYTVMVGMGDRALLFVGQALWVTDGTIAGTERLADVEGDFLGAEELGGATLFVTAVGEYRADLWRTDGTVAGTQRLALIPTYFPYGNPLVKAGRRVFLLFADTLWTSDGTEAGTRVAIESLPELDMYAAGSAVGYRGGIAFEAEPPEGGTLELWFTDGTVPGTRRLATPEPFFSDHQNPLLRVLGRHLLYAAGGMLWTSDGTPRGTALLAGCRDGCPEDYWVTDVELDGELLLRGWDERHGGELWRTDGTGPGTRIVRESCPGPCGYVVTDPVAWRGGVAYLTASAAGVTLWFSDGTAAGTRALVELGDLDGNGELLVVGDRLYVMLSLPASGWQLWTLDGTAAGSRPLTRQLDYRRTEESGVRSWARPDGGVFVQNGSRLLASDGSREGTFELGRTLLGVAGGLGIALRGSGHGTNELVALSGDGAPERFLAELPPGYWIRWAAPFDDSLALSFPSLSAAGERGEELWITDGTAAGTGRRFAFPTGEPVFAGSDGGAFYFLTAGTGIGGGSLLWKSDGTAAGTVELAHRPGILPPLVRAGDELFFVAAGRSFGPELWRTDGSPQGTRPVFDDGGPARPTQLASLGGALYLAAAAAPGDAEAGQALWRLDPDTRQLTELGQFAVIGGSGWTFATTAERLFFAAAETPLSGDALWVTDGTAAGTTRLAALTPAGSAFSDDAPLPAPAALGDQLLFTALDRDHGTEPWSTDGTPAGTRLLRDLVPGPQGSFAAGWVAAGGRAFFAAGDGVRAAGLYAYDPGAAACATSAEHVCLDGRWEAELAFPDPSDDFVATATAIATGDSSAAFAHPLESEPLVVVRASPAAGGGESVAVAGLTRRWWIGTVTDTATGEARRYVGLPGAAMRFDDRAAFDAAGSPAKAARPARALTAARLPSRVSSPMASHASAGTMSACASDSATACLLGGAFAVRGRSLGVLGAARSLGSRLALLDWPDAGSAGEPDADPDAGPDAVVRIAPTAAGGFEVFFAALAPMRGVAVVRDAAGRRVEYVNDAGELALVDDVTTFAPRP